MNLLLVSGFFVRAREALYTILRKELFDVVFRRKVEGSCLEIEFPWDSKKLDEYLGTVFPTVQKHHYYKACGGERSHQLWIWQRNSSF